MELGPGAECGFWKHAGPSRRVRDRRADNGGPIMEANTLDVIAVSCRMWWVAAYPTWRMLRMLAWNRVDNEIT